MARHSVDPIVDTIVVKQDIGSYEPAYKKIMLELHEDGSVTWRKLTEEESKPKRNY